MNCWQEKVYCHIQSSQTMSEASPASCSILHRIKHLGPEGKCLSLSVTRIKILSVFSLCTYTPLCSLSVMRLMKHGDMIWSVFILMMCVAYSTNCCVKNGNWLNNDNNLFVYRQLQQNAVKNDEEFACIHCLFTLLFGTPVSSDWGRRWGKSLCCQL
jgi:uncharacterized membrane protein YhaH (DUF805 family)